MKANSLIKTVYSINPKTIASLCAMMLLISGIYGITHAAPPEFPATETGKRSISESAPVGAFIERAVRAVDTDPGDTLKYTLDESYPDTAYFDIVETSGRLRLKQKVDFENPGDAFESPATVGDNGYLVVVIATDKDDNEARQEIVITVNNANERPMFVVDKVATETPNDFSDDTPITKVSAMVAENTNSGQNIALEIEIDGGAPPTRTVMTNDEDGRDTNPSTSDDDDLIYSLTGTDAGHFDIDITTGELKTKTVLDFEAPIDRGGPEAADNFYTVVVRVTDSASGGLSNQLTVTIEITDVNEAPEFRLGPNNAIVTTIGRNIAENAPAGTKVGLPIKATDPDEGDILSYGFEGAVTKFVIESDGQLKTTEPLDHETTGSYIIVVTATDDGGDADASPPIPNLSNTIAVTITVDDRNDPPEFTDADTGTDGTQIFAAAITVDENYTGVFGPPITATDPDGDRLIYTLTSLPGRDDAKLFDIDPSTRNLRTRAGLDLEAEDYPTDGYMIRVTVSDRRNDAGSSDSVIDDTGDITITLNNVDEAPMFRSSTASLSVYVGAITVADPDQELIATDPDSSDTTISYSHSGPDAGRFTIPAGVLTPSPVLTATDPRTYRVTVIARDSNINELSDTIDVTIQLLETTATASPEFVFDEGETTFSFDVRENTKGFIGRVRATDADGDTLTYSITTNPGEAFRVDQTGRLYNTEPLDFEDATLTSTITVTVSVTDGGTPVTTNVIITVVNVNEPPVFGTLTAPITYAVRAVAENVDKGIALGTEDIPGTASPVTAADPETTDTVTYTLSGTDAALFAIDAADDSSATPPTTAGQLRTLAKLDYETKSIYHVTVSATDGNTPPVSIPVTILVVNVDEAPMFTADKVTLEMPEDISMNANIGMPVAATDPEGDKLTYRIDDTDTTNSPDNALFGIRQAFGQLFYEGGTEGSPHTVDFEGDKLFYQIKVYVRDGDTDSTDDDSVIVLIKVTNVDEPPMFADGMTATRNIEENKFPRYPIGERILATDPEGAALRYNSLGNVPGSTDAASFILDPDGQLRTKTSLDHETQDMYKVMVSVTDGKNTAKIPVTINVGDINEMPMFTEGDSTTRSILERVEDEIEAIQIDLPILAKDPDEGDTLAYGIAPGPDSNLFTISSTAPDSGKLSTIARATADDPEIFDYDMKPDGTPPKRTYQIVVTVTDNLADDGTTSDVAIDDTIMVTVNVTNVNEMPSFSADVGDTTNPPDAVYVHAGKAGNRVIDPDGVFRATDPDGDRLTYLLKDADSSFFSIDRNGMVTARQAVPKAPASRSITVSVRDPGGRAAEQTVSITVQPVTAAKDNKKPTFPETELGERDVDENTAPDMDIGDPVAAEDGDTADTLIYRLGGTDMRSFAIDPATGQLKTKAMLDYEAAKNTYTVTVTANDGTHDSEQPKQVTITVNNVAENPMFEEGATTTRSVAENTPEGTRVGRPVEADDSDGDDLTYSLTAAPSPNASDIDSFEIDSDGQLTTSATAMLNHETKDTYIVVVNASDGDSSRDDTITVYITVTDVNDKPMFANADTPRAARTVAENVPKGTDIVVSGTEGGAVMATDEDGDPVTHSLHGTDRGVFDIEPATGQLKTRQPLDHETKETYSVTVRAVDGRGGSADVNVTITVTDVNDPPVFPSNRVYRRTVKENQPAAATEGAVAFGAPVLATDQDQAAGTDLAYTLSGPDANFFDIDDVSIGDDDDDAVSQFGQLITKDDPRLDYEADRNGDGRVDANDRTYEVVVTATDSADAIASTIVTITVTNVDEGPMFVEDTVSRLVLENKANSPVGAPVTATDPEGDSITYSLDGADKALFTVPRGQITTKDGLDHETKPTATVKVVATAGKKKAEATVTITVVNVSEAPMFDEVAPINRDISEGVEGAPVVGGAVEATDPDGGSPRYTLKPSIDAESFEIGQYSGILTSKVKLDYEADRNGDGRHTSADYTYMVTVIATDDGGLSSEAVVTITVLDEPEAPMFPEHAGEIFVYEGAQGAKVYDPDGALIATDGDGDRLTYSKSGSDAEIFNINPNTGQLTTARALDYDAAGAQQEFNVMVGVSDGTGSSADKAVTIKLRNVTEDDNSAPQFLKDGTPISRDSIEVEENTEGVIGEVYAEDANGDLLVYTLRAQDKVLFTVGSDGTLSSKKPLDFDRRRGYTIVVTVSDSQLSDTLTVTITGINVNEAPMFVDADGVPILSEDRSIAEGPSGRDIGDPVLATDPDGDTLTYTLDPESQRVFSLSPQRVPTGVQLTARTALDFETGPSYTVIITVRDSKDDDDDPDTAPDDTITVRVMVTNVNEEPKFANADGTAFDKTRTIVENQKPDTTVGDPVTAIDEENDPLTYSLLGANTDSVPFKIGESTGQLTTTVPLDYEARKVYMLTVYASDRKHDDGRSVADNVNDYDATVRITVNVTDVNEAINALPVFVNTAGDTITSATRTVEENAANANVGAPVEANDPDPGDTLTYSISTTGDAASFTIDPNTGQLRTNGTLNYEADRDMDGSVTSADYTYEVAVTATDPGRPSATPPGPALSTTILVTVTVKNVNEAPTFPNAPATPGASALYVYEGTAPETVHDPAGELMADDPDSGDTLTYDIDANSKTVFDINANTGVLTTKVALDFEADPPQLTYTVTFTATDAGGESASTRVSIAVRNVTGDETGETNNAPVFVTSATDDTPLSSVDRKVEEHIGNEMDSKNVGDVILVKDDDATDTLTYTLGGANADLFTVEKVATGVQLKTATVLEYDGDPAPERTYEVTITVSDGNTADDATITVNIDVTDNPDDTVNTNPAFARSHTTRSIEEGTGVRTIGAPVDTTDDNNDKLEYTLTGLDAASFTIDRDTGQLSTKSGVTLEYDGPSAKLSYRVTVGVSDKKDDNGNPDTEVDDTIRVTINVENDSTDDGADPDPTRNDPPKVSATLTRSILTDATVGSEVGSPVPATDPEGGTLTFEIISGDTAFFAIDLSGQLTTRQAVTARTYRVTVRVTDNGTPPASATTTITITVTQPADPGQPPAPQPLPDTPGTPGTTPPATNDAPTFDDGTATTREVAENTAAGTNIGTPVGATDPNNDPLTYTLGGADAASFSINSTSGQLMTSAALDFEVKNVYTVVVTADDGLTGGTASITVTINVTDVSVADGDPAPTNTAPVFTDGTATTREVAENTAAGRNIGALVAATDTDTGEVLTYTVGGTDMGSFAINGATGQLMTQGALDHETKASYTVTVTATDSGGLTDSITVTITVTDVNEAPAFASATAERLVDENTAAGMAIGDAFTATDPDDGDALAYSLGGTDMASFAINATTGQLMTRGMLDYETKDSHTVMVIATDSGGLTGSITVTITVTDVNDAPRFASDTATRMVEENTAAGMAIGAPVMAMDDDGDELTYALGGTDMASFAIDTATGQLKTMADLDHEAKASHTVTVTASDRTLMSSAITVTIMVTDIPEFMLSVPSGQSLIHVPLRMAGLAKISDLYDKLGGAANVNLLITHDPVGQRWLSYLGDRNRGQASDRDLTDDLGILADMKNAVTLQLSGDALGTNGTASIMLQAGSNLVGVPLKDSRITNVSDLLALDGIRDNVSFIIVADGGEYRTVGRAGDDGDVAVTGGQSFILSATEAATVTITGDGWASSTASSAPSWMSQMGVQKEGMTAALAVTGSIVDEVKGLTDFHITVKNLSTGKVDTVATDENGAGYQLTFVDIETGRAAQIGDTLEITARSADPLVGVEPLRYVVTVEDVKRGHIQLDTLITYEVPAKTELLRNYPNPFNPETWIPYRLAKAATVTLTIYNQNGGVVRELHIGHRIAAVYETRSKAIYWDGRNNLGERVASGIYFYHLTAGNYSAVRKMAIVK